MIDNQNVDYYEGKFSGKFPTDYQDGEMIEIGDVVTFVVTCAVKSIGHTTNKVGDIIRTNTYNVDDAVIVPIGKVAALKSAVTDEYALGQIETAPMFDVSDDDLDGLTDEELSV